MDEFPNQGRIDFVWLRHFDYVKICAFPNLERFDVVGLLPGENAA